MEILWKGTVSAYFRANRPKLWGNCAFPENFHTMELGEITVFYVVYLNKDLLLALYFSYIHSYINYANLV